MGSVLGASSNITLTSEEVSELSQQTLFKEAEIQKLYHRFRHLDRTSSGTISRSEFLMIPELAMNVMCDRIVSLFLDPRTLDANFVQFVMCLNQLHPQASPDVKAKLAFRCYDIDNDGIISVEDLTKALKYLVGNNLSEAQLNMIAVKTIRETTCTCNNNNTGISFSDFRKVLGSNNDIITALSVDPCIVLGDDV